MSEVSNRKKLIVVLGMHRSGTSALTRGLKALGADLGDHLLPPKKDNPKGFWEDVDIYQFDIDVLSAINSDWYYITPIEETDIQTLAARGYVLRAVDLLKRKLANAQCFVFKDPRVTKLLPFWSQVFSHLDVDVCYVMTLRNPLSVARSLAEREGFVFTHSYLLWLGYVLESLRGSAGMQRILVDYDRLVESPREQLGRIANTFQLMLDLQELEEYENSCIDARLRHTVYSRNDLSLDPACPPLVKEVFSRLDEVASGNVNPEDPNFQTEVNDWITRFGQLKSTLQLIDIYIGKLMGDGLKPEPIHKAQVYLEARVYLVERVDGSVQPYRQDRSTAFVYEQNDKEKLIDLVLPDDLGSLARLRLDIANTPTAIALRELSLHQKSGEELWRWDGRCDAFVSPSGVVCLPGERGVKLLCWNDDPQFELAIPEAILALVQGGAVLRLVLSAKPLLEELPSVLESTLTKARPMLPTLAGVQLPAGLGGHLEELADLIEMQINRKNAIISTQRAEIDALRGREQMLYERLVRAESQLELLKEFALSEAGNRLERL